MTTTTTKNNDDELYGLTCLYCIQNVMVDGREINLGVGKTLAAMRRAVRTARAGTQDSPLLGGLADMTGPVLAKIGEEVIMRGIAVLVGGC